MWEMRSIPRSVRFEHTARKYLNSSIRKCKDGTNTKKEEFIFIFIRYICIYINIAYKAKSSILLKVPKSHFLLL